MYIRLWSGSIGRIAYVSRVGTTPSVGAIGTVSRVGTVGARNFWGTVIRDRVPLGPGSTWIGSWHDVGKYRVKTVTVFSRRAGGSISIITGATGTGPTRLTGTYWGPTQVYGSYTATSFTEALGWLRPVFRRSGTYRGTVTVGLGLQT